MGREAEVGFCWRWSVPGVFFILIVFPLLLLFNKLSTEGHRQWRAHFFSTSLREHGRGGVLYCLLSFYDHFLLLSSADSLRRSSSRGMSRCVRGCQLRTTNYITENQSNSSESSSSSRKIPKKKNWFCISTRLKTRAFPRDSISRFSYYLFFSLPVLGQSKHIKTSEVVSEPAPILVLYRKSRVKSSFKSV